MPKQGELGTGTSRSALAPAVAAKTWANAALGVVLGAAILAGLFLRWQHIADYPLTVDEVFSLSFTRYGFAEMWTSPLDANPPLYYALLKLATNLGTSDIALRLPSLILGGLGLLSIYLLARIFFDRLTALFAAALLAVHHYHIDYSLDARAYALWFLLVTLSAIGLAGFCRAVIAGAGANRRLFLALYCAAAVAAFYAHMSAAIWIFASGLAVLFAAIRYGDRRIRAELMVAAGVSGLACIYIFKVVSPELFNYMLQPDLAAATRIYVDLLLPAIGGIPNASIYGLFAVVALAGLYAPGKDTALLLVLATFAAFAALLWLFGFAIKPILMTRSALIVVIAAALVAAAALSLLQRRPVARCAAAAVVLTLYGVSSVQHLEDERHWRNAHWDTRAAFLQDTVTADDVLLLCNQYHYGALRRNLPDDFNPALFAAFSWRTGDLIIFASPAAEGKPWIDLFTDYHLGRHRWMTREELARFARDRRIFLDDTRCPDESAAEALEDLIGRTGRPVWQRRGIEILLLEPPADDARRGAAGWRVRAATATPAAPGSAPR